MVEPLHGAAHAAAIRQLAGWSEVEDRDAIRKTYHFGTFREAWGFMSVVALIAEKMDQRREPSRDHPHHARGRGRHRPRYYTRPRDR